MNARCSPRHLPRVSDGRSPGETVRCRPCRRCGPSRGWRPVALLPGETPSADGEVVWSWRRDRGVYPARPCGLGNGDNQRRSPGRARISCKTSRGESRRGRAVPVVLAHVLRTWDARVLRRMGSAGAFGARLSLRPLFKRGKTKGQNPGKPCRGNGSVCLLARMLQTHSGALSIDQGWMTSRLTVIGASTLLTSPEGPATSTLNL
jgi:hypothetical protein